MADQQQILTFELNDLQLALDVENIQEVLLEGDFQDVPLTPDYVTGLFTLRGQIVTAINLKKRFGLPGEIPSEYSIIVIKKDTEYVGLIVDSVGDVVQIETSDLRTLPANLKSEWGPWQSKILRQENAITIIPDTEQILQN